MDTYDYFFDWKCFKYNFKYKMKHPDYKKALLEDHNFLAGLNVHRGNVTHKAVADSFGHKFVTPQEAIS